MNNLKYVSFFLTVFFLLIGFHLLVIQPMYNDIEESSYPRVNPIIASESCCQNQGGCSAWETCSADVACAWTEPGRSCQDAGGGTPRPPPPPEPTTPPTPTWAPPPTQPPPPTVGPGTQPPTVGPDTPTPTGGGGGEGCGEYHETKEELGLGLEGCSATQMAVKTTWWWDNCTGDYSIDCVDQSTLDHGPVWLQVYSNEGGQRYYWKGNDGVDKVSDGPASIVARDPVTGMFTRIQSYYTGPEAFFSQTLNKTDSLMDVWIEDGHGSSEFWASHFCGAGRAYKPGSFADAGAFDPYLISCKGAPFFATCKIDQASCDVGAPHCEQDYDGCAGDFSGGSICPSGNCRAIGYYDALRRLLQRINPGPFEGRWTGNNWVVESWYGNSAFDIELYVRPPGGYKCKEGTFRGAYYISNDDTNAYGAGKFEYNKDVYYTCRAKFNPGDDGNLFAVEVEPLPKTENIKTRVILDTTATRVFPLSGGSDFTFTPHNGTNLVPSWLNDPDPYALLSQWADNQALLVTLNHTDPAFDTLVSCDWTWDYLSTPGIDFSGQDANLSDGCTIDTSTVSHPPAIYPVIQSGPASPNENYIEFNLVSELPTPIPDTPTPTSTPTPTQTPTPLPGAGAQTLFCPL